MGSLSWYEGFGRYEDYYQQPVYPMPLVYENPPVLAIPSLIVNKILSYFTLPDLKNKRLVSKQWNEEAGKLMREKLQIKFHDYLKVKSYSVHLSHYKDFCDSFYFGSRISLKAPVVTQFFVNFGHHIRSLEIRSRELQLTVLKDALYFLLPNLEQLIIDSKIYYNKYNQYQGGMFTFGNLQIQPIWAPPLPKLKTLSLQIKYAEYRSVKNQNGKDDSKNDDLTFNNNNNLSMCVHPFPVLVKELLIAAINLEEITSCAKDKRKMKIPSVNDKTIESHEINDLNIEYFDSMMDPKLSKSDLCIWSTLLDGWDSFPKLQKINFTLKATNDCVQKLTAKYFPLSKLDLFLEPDVTNRNLYYLLESLKGTLQHVKLKYHSKERPEFEVDLPIGEPFYSVKTVDLEGYQGSLRFVYNFPNLTHFILRRLKLNKAVLKDVHDPNPTPLWFPPPGLNSFEVYQDLSFNDGNNRQRSIQCVQKLGQLFPFVRKLRLEKLIDESLCLIYAQWPYLEELEIVEGLFSDSGTTGIHPNAYKVILREEAYDRFNVPALRQGPYIGNLMRLKKLNIHSPKITDVTVILGAMQCPNIESLTVQSYLITDSSLRRLTNKTTLTYLRTEHCNQLSPQVMDFVRKKFQERGGHASLNEYKGPLQRDQIREFLLKHPKVSVCLKRLQLGNSTTKEQQQPKKKIKAQKESKTTKIQDLTAKKRTRYPRKAQTSNWLTFRKEK